MNVGWQEELRQRLIERNARESAYSGIIEQCTPVHFERLLIMMEIISDRRLSQQTRMLKERNQSLLRAMGSVRNQPPGSTNMSNSTVASGEE